VLFDAAAMGCDDACIAVPVRADDAVVDPVFVRSFKVGERTEVFGENGWLRHGRDILPKSLSMMSSIREESIPPVSSSQCS
jgi:hypothetical protein